jgi:uncharacterized membrane protein YgaE (UPF0421/DUF939 family)
MNTENMTQMIIAKDNPSTFLHSLRTAVAALTSLLIARLCRLPEAYWASISTLIVMQSTLGAALPISAQRFAGTAMGVVVGGLAAVYFRENALVFGIAVFLLGILCTVFRVERSAYRYASVAVAIVMLVPRANSAWVIAIHRFVEVSIGIAVGLVLTALWPEQRPPSLMPRS